MPKYSVVTPQFQGISFDEMIKPLNMYKEEYDKQTAELGNLGVLTDSIGGLLSPDETQDVELKSILQNYQNDFNTAVDNLSSTGNLNDVRGDLLKLKRRYASELQPIQVAAQSRLDQIKSFDEAKAKDPYLLGDDPRNTSVSDYMNGNSPSLYSVSGQSLYTMGQIDAKAASARVRKYSEWGLDPNLTSQYFTQALIEGWSQDELSNALRNEIINQRGKAPSNADLTELTTYLYDAYNRIANATAIDNLDDDQYLQAGNMLMNGIISGITYDTKYEHLKNEHDAYYYERLRGLRLENDARERALNALETGNGDGNGGGNDGLDGAPFGITPMYQINGSVEKVSEAAELMGDLQNHPENIDKPTGSRIQDPNYIPPKSYAGYVPMVDETYGDRLYRLAYGLGRTNQSRNEFIQSWKNMSSQDKKNIINSLQSEIEANAQLYSEYYSNVTNPGMNLIVKSVNDNNSGFATTNKTGLFYDADKRKLVKNLPTGGTFRLPIQAVRKGSLLYSVPDKDDPQHKPNKAYYVNPSAFSGASIIFEDNIISLSDAINKYYEAIENKDSDRAQYLGKSIMRTVTEYRRSTSTSQSETSADNNPSM